MIGYFYQLKIWDSLALSSAQLQTEISSTCLAGACLLCPNVIVGAGRPCLQSLSSLIFELDLEQDAQTLNSQRTGTQYQFKLGESTAVSTFDDPIRVNL